MADFKNTVSGWLNLGKKQQEQMIDEDVIQPGEILGAGFDIPKGDPRLKSGVSRSNLSNYERGLLDTYRKNKKP